MNRKRQLIHGLLPTGTKRKSLVKKLFGLRIKLAAKNPIPFDYHRWVTECEPDTFKNTVKAVRRSEYRPLISIVVPCYNTPHNYIDSLVDSVIGQVYENWQLCLADGSIDQGSTDYLKKISQKDTRITFVKIKKNLGIAGNTNIGIKKATGEFVAFLDHDDVLSRFALAEVVLALNEDKNLDLIYSDEDKLSDNGKERLLPFFKPDWSPDLLLGVNYITHFLVVRKNIVDKLGGLRLGFDGAQDYDFLLRFTEMTTKIKHIPKVLYHWRLAKGSTSRNVGQKDYADAAGQRALRDAVKRRKIEANVVEIKERPTNYRLKYHVTEQPLVSIIIPFKDKVHLLKQCVNSIITKTTYRNYELILVSNNSTESETHEYLGTIEADERCKIFAWDEPFNYSAINNFGRSKARGSILVLLNNDTKVITPNWLEELVGVASQPGIGAVGPLLHYANGSIQHAGVVIGLGGMAGHVFRNRDSNDWTEFGMPCWPRDYIAVTGACLVIKTNLMDKMNGLDEAFTIAGNDVALGIKLYEAGYRNVYWPFAELVHFENASVGSYNNVPKMDYDHSLTYYKPYLNWEDPYFNQNLDLMNEQISMRSTYDEE